jgi:hypothetical protein
LWASVASASDLDKLSCTVSFAQVERASDKIDGITILASRMIVPPAVVSVNGERRLFVFAKRRTT